MATFSLEQLNFFKFSSVVLDEFPIALRQVFVHMWDNQVAPTPGFQKWDDSPLVRDMFLSKEGGKTKYVPSSKSYHEWDCTALFEATLYAQSFAISDGSGGLSTLNKLYVKPRHLPSGTFHPVISIPGNEAETFALALDQLRLLRNALCHQTSTQKIDKPTFDYYIKLAREALAALKQDTTRIDEIGKLEEEDFPTARLQKLEAELKKEKDIDVKFKQINDHLNQIESQIKTVRSDVKAVERKLGNVESDVKIATTELAKVKANVDDVKKAEQSGVPKDVFVPGPSIPYEIPNFVGRDKECKAVEHHLTDEFTRLVNVWGPPGFGKTSVATRVAHHLQEKNIPVYFVSVREMESKEDLVSKLLSMFADDKQVGHISSSHLIIQYLQQIQNPLVLILDNADDLFESGDTRRKEHVLQFIEEILTHCKQIKLLLTTRESLDFLSHKLSIYLEKINVLDEISSADLVRLLLPHASDDECNCVVRECGSVPLSMRLMCSLIKEANVSINALLQEMNNSTLVDVLDIECFPNNVRLKSVIKTSFERLTIRERDAFVSLSVFPEWFGLDEAQAILNAKTEFQTKQIIRSLERRSLIDCADNFSHFTIHSLFRSFIEEETKNDQAVGNTFLNAQLQFYDYYISSCKVANENFLKRRFGDAFRSFLDRRGCIISSLLNGPRKDKIYPKAIELLSEAKSFLFVALHGEHLFKNLYDMALEEAKKRGNSEDEQRLYSAKELPPCSTVKSFFWLSRVQREAGDLEGAMKSVKVGRKLLGHRELDAGQQGKADLKGSMASLQRATDIKLNDDTASSYHDLGLWHRKMGRINKALVSLKKAALLRSSELGDHKDTANSYYWLGIVQREMGDLYGALKSAEVSLRLRKDLLGDDTSTADSFHEKGVIHYSVGDYKLAVEALQKAGDMNFVLRGEHKNTACCYHNLGEAQSMIKDHEKALDSLQRATDMRSKVLGDHEHTALSYHILSLEQRAMGDLKGALDSMQIAANMRSNLLGDHKDTASSYHELGVMQHGMGDLKGALQSLPKALDMRTNLLGDHGHTTSSLNELRAVRKKLTSGRSLFGKVFRRKNRHEK